jgi:hypothetical protein
MTRARALCGALLLGAVAALCQAPAAAAGTVSVSPRSPTEAVVVYRDVTAARNDLRVLADLGQGGQVDVTDRSGVSPGPGCEPSGQSGEEAVCLIPPGSVGRLELRLGGRNDNVDLRGVSGSAVTVAGGPGNDSISGPGHELSGTPSWLVGVVGVGAQASAARLRQGPGAGSTLLGGPGNDKLGGGAGPDWIVPGPGVDYVVGWRGDDRVDARDGAVDHIECDAGRDRLTLDRLDFPYLINRVDSRGFSHFTRCGPAQRSGAPSVLALSVDWDNDDLGFTGLALGCPADSGGPCRGWASVSLRGGRRLFGGRYRIAPGHLGGPYDEFSDAVNYALVRRGARVRVRARDSDGRLRTISRVLEVSYSPGGPD